MPTNDYLNDLKRQFSTGIAREHAYRPALKQYLESLNPDVIATNDPARISCGAPDYILTKDKIDVGYIEAKDIGANLDHVESDEQLGRYRESLENLILTDYLEFRFYRNGEKTETVRIGRVVGGEIEVDSSKFAYLESVLKNFSTFAGTTIKSAKKLAEMMARKASLMREIFFNVISESADQTDGLPAQFRAFRHVLVHDMDAKQFADVYAQTIAYGLFTARLHDTTPEDFSRSEAMALIPKSNPFLRQLFHYVAGPELDERVDWIVDALCVVFQSTDLDAVLADFGSGTGHNDPVLHFYETFLGEYDASLRKARGVWYTPEAVVNFIVRAIDDVLKSAFNIKRGISDQSKVTIQVESQTKDRRTKSGVRMRDLQVHKVQLLDVATGTGTFLAAVVKQIFAGFKGQEGLWSAYVESDLIPRMHGFELLMASYAMCHMKLDMLLQETSYVPSNIKAPPRLSVYLTNSLEEHHPDVDTLFASWLSKEANEASYIKKNMPIMVAFGNPPYSGESRNKGDWIMDLIQVYKQEPGGGPLKEKNPKWLNDDYVKFIRLGEYYVEKNGEGILAYITNHSYLDNPTFRGMRWHLLNTFSKLFIVNLHGSSQRREITPDGEPDKNVFDIQQGVSIIVAIRAPEKVAGELAEVEYVDVWGDRETKYDLLNNSSLASLDWSRLEPVSNDYLLVPRDASLYSQYDEFIAVDKLFNLKTTGIVTARDKLTIGLSSDDVISTVTEFASLETEAARTQFNLGKDVQDWKVHLAQKDIKGSGIRADLVRPISYRLFDTRFTYFTGNSRGFICRPRADVMRHFHDGENIGLITARSNKSGRADHFFVSRHMSEAKTGESSTQSCIMPLYLYVDGIEGERQRISNLDKSIVDKVEETVPGVTELALFDYIYAMLYCPSFRETYAEFLTSGYPRVPYPVNAQSFSSLSNLGATLRSFHLLECDDVEDFLTQYPVGGDHAVQRYVYDDEKVWINKAQYFSGVPVEVWDLFIGGYQPARKWLKDRKGRKLTIDEVSHYQKVIVSLQTTIDIMKKIELEYSSVME